MAGDAGNPKRVAIRAKGTWEEGMRTNVTVRNFPPIIVDEPEDFGGSDSGANPLEYLLGALMGCETVLFAMVADEKGFSYEGLEYDLKGTLDLRGLEGAEGVRAYFDEIRGTTKVITAEPREKLLEVAREAERRCPVYSMLVAADVAMNIEWVAVDPETADS